MENIRNRLTKVDDNTQKRKLNGWGCLIAGCLGSILVGLLCVAAPIAIIAGMWGSVYNEGIRQEQTLNAQYVDNQNILSQYLSELHNKMGIASANTADLDKVLSDAMKGGYTQVCSDKNECGLNQGAPFYGAVIKAYPSLGDITSLYKSIFDTISKGEATFAQHQSVLIDKLRAFDTWRVSYPRNAYAIIPGLSFPDTNLTARINDQSWTAKDAENKMWQIVTASVVQSDYKSGTRQDLETPTPSK